MSKAASLLKPFDVDSFGSLRETALLGLAVLGGSIGAWLGMKVWHHKTQHKGGNRDIDNIVGGYQFKYGIPAIIIIQLVIIGYFLYLKIKA